MHSFLLATAALSLARPIATGAEIDAILELENVPAGLTMAERMFLSIGARIVGFCGLNRPL